MGYVKTGGKGWGFEGTPWTPSEYATGIDYLEVWVPVYYINITFPERVIVENIIPRNVIINRGVAEVDNHISRDDIFDYHPLRECNIYFIIPNKALNPWFAAVLSLIPTMVKGVLKAK